MAVGLVARLRAAGCVFAEEEAALLRRAAPTAEELETAVRRRVAGVPLEQVLGYAVFCGAQVAVAEGVFVPRRRTELLVELAVAHARPGDVVVDLCCGSGAVGLAVRAGVGQVELHAVDLDPAAVRCARPPVEAVGGSVHEGDLFGPLPRGLAGRVEVLVVNAPYVPSAELALLPPEARLHEPRLALDGGDDGLDVQRRVLAGAGEWLSPSGAVLVETSRRQAAGTVAAAVAGGLVGAVEICDERDATVVVGRRPGAAPRVGPAVAYVRDAPR